MDCAIVIDCDEEHARANAGSRADEIDAYKTNTLPVLGHYEDTCKLQYVSKTIFHIIRTIVGDYLHYL